MKQRASRREFFETLGAGAVGFAVGTSGISSASGQTRARSGGTDGQVLRIGDKIAVADTTYGKVRGYILRDIHYFLGIPYGADTSGASRFMPPRKPKAWTDVFPAIWWGNSAPQNMENRYANKYASFRDHWNYDDVSEDCLRLNVFTPAINDGRKRPVMGGPARPADLHRCALTLINSVTRVTIKPPRPWRPLTPPRHRACRRPVSSGRSPPSTRSGKGGQRNVGANAGPACAPQNLGEIEVGSAERHLIGIGDEKHLSSRHVGTIGR